MATLAGISLFFTSSNEVIYQPNFVNSRTPRFMISFCHLAKLGICLTFTFQWHFISLLNLAAFFSL